jgi:hypothetical protein
VTRNFIEILLIAMIGVFNLSTQSIAQEPLNTGAAQDELRDYLNAINYTAVLAGLINLGTTRDSRASSLKIHHDNENSILVDDTRDVNLNRLYVNLYRPIGDSGKLVRLGVYVSNSKTEEDFQLNRLFEYAGTLNTKSKNIGFDLALKIPLGSSRWSIMPGVGFGYTKFSFNHDYVGVLGEQIIKPIAEGVFFNWKSDVFSYRGIITAKYELPFGDRMLFELEGTYVHSLIDSFKVSDQAQKTNSNFDTIFTRIRINGPTNMVLFKKPLGWRVTVSNTSFVGKNDGIQGFRWYNRYDADLIWNYSGQIRYLSEITFGVGWLNGKNVEGFSVGFGIRLKV